MDFFQYFQHACHIWMDGSTTWNLVPKATCLGAFRPPGASVCEWCVCGAVPPANVFSLSSILCSKLIMYKVKWMFSAASCQMMLSHFQTKTGHFASNLVRDICWLQKYGNCTQNDLVLAKNYHDSQKNAHSHMVHDINPGMYLAPWKKCMPLGYQALCKIAEWPSTTCIAVVCCIHKY